MVARVILGLLVFAGSTSWAIARVTQWDGWSEEHPIRWWFITGLLFLPAALVLAGLIYLAIKG